MQPLVATNFAQKQGNTISEVTEFQSVTGSHICGTQNFVLRININGENRYLRQARNRCAKYITKLYIQYQIFSNIHFYSVPNFFQKSLIKGM